MPNAARSLKVGLLLVAAVIAAAVTWKVLFKQQTGGDSYQLYALFHDATGLVPRSRVQTAGIAIGEIEGIRLVNGMARVDIRVQGNIPVYRNATISRKSVSVLGEFLLVVTPGTTDRPRLRPGERIDTVNEGTSTDEILNNIQRISADVQRVTAQVANALGNDDTSRELRETLRNVTEITREVNRTVAANSDVVTHALGNIDRLTTTASPDVVATMRNLREATDRLAQVLGRGQGNEENTVTRMQDTVANLTAASRELRETLEHANHIAATTDRGEGNLGRLVRDETLIDEIQGVAEGVNDLVGPIGRLQTIVGLRSEYQFISNTLRSTVELRLQPREDKYYLLEFVQDPRGSVQNVSTTTDTTDPTMTAHVRTTQRITTDSLRVSLMLAQRLGPVTFRYGIKESTGGVGLDLHLLDNRLEIRSDLFGFGESQYPRLRMMAALNVLERAWIIAGVDDVFNGDRFDYFLGAQLRFNDEDLKSILPFAGGLTSSGGRR